MLLGEMVFGCFLVFFVGFLVGRFWDGGLIFVVFVLKMNFVML